jgi:mono/diheme cytochrome c family protein
MRTVMTCLALLLFAPLDARAAADGKAVFEARCASCHGADGKGVAAKEAALKLEAGKLNLGRDEVASQTRDEKKELTTRGKGKMPGYEKKLSAEELDGVADYTMKLIAAIRGK